MTPQLLRSLPRAPAEMARALVTAHEADVAEALNRVDPAAAPEVLSAFPFEFSVRVVEHPEFERRHEVFRHFATDKGVAFIRAISPDQQAHLFREATSLIIHALALREIRVADWWRVAARELPAGLSLGTILGVIGILRIAVWQSFAFYDYGLHWPLVALTVGAALVGVVTFGSLTGSSTSVSPT